MEELSSRLSSLTNRGGAPFGNQNARKHGFYSTVLTDEEREAMNVAGQIEGIDGEIALMRVKLQSVVRDYPWNTHLIIEITNALVRLFRTRAGLKSPQDDKFRRGLFNVYRMMAQDTDEETFLAILRHELRGEHDLAEEVVSSKNKNNPKQKNEWACEHVTDS